MDIPNIFVAQLPCSHLPSLPPLSFSAASVTYLFCLHPFWRRGWVAIRANTSSHFTLHLLPLLPERRAALRSRAQPRATSLAAHRSTSAPASPLPPSRFRLTCLIARTNNTLSWRLQHGWFDASPLWPAHASPHNLLTCLYLSHRMPSLSGTLHRSACHTRLRALPGTRAATLLSQTRTLLRGAGQAATPRRASSGAHSPSHVYNAAHGARASHHCTTRRGGHIETRQDDIALLRASTLASAVSSTRLPSTRLFAPFIFLPTPSMPRGDAFWFAGSGFCDRIVMMMMLERQDMAAISTRARRLTIFFSTPPHAHIASHYQEDNSTAAPPRRLFAHGALALAARQRRCDWGSRGLCLAAPLHQQQPYRATNFAHRTFTAHRLLYATCLHGTRCAPLSRNISVLASPVSLTHGTVTFCHPCMLHRIYHTFGAHRGLCGRQYLCVKTQRRRNHMCG